MIARGWYLMGLGLAGLAVVCLLACAPKPKPVPPLAQAETQGTGPAQVPAPTHGPKDLRDWFPNSKRWSASAIHFAFDQTLIRPSELEKLYDIARHVQGHCRIEGHASEEGTEVYNLALAYARAMAVNLFLKAADAKVDAEVISFGEEKPITLDPREVWKNRRVEVVCR